MPSSPFLFCQAITNCYKPPPKQSYDLNFIKVTLTTVAELYNDDDDTINHHGFHRQVNKDTMEKDGKVHDQLPVLINLVLNTNTSFN